MQDPRRRMSWSRLTQVATAQSSRVLASPSRLLPRRGVRLTPKALTLLEHCTTHLVMPNVRGNLPAEEGAGWPRKDNLRQRPERPDCACRSGSG